MAADDRIPQADLAREARQLSAATPKKGPA
jgi:hypothetical protein